MSQSLLIALILAGLGLIFALAGGGIMLNARKFRRRALRARGMVVRLREDSSGEGPLYYPVVRFTTGNGRQVEAEAGYGSNPPSDRPGQEVDVLYDPERPTRMRIDTALGNGILAGTLLLACGCFMFVFGTALALSL